MVRLVCSVCVGLWQLGLARQACQVFGRKNASLRSSGRGQGLVIHQGWPIAAVGGAGSLSLYFDGGRHQLSHTEHCAHPFALDCTTGALLADLHFVF